GKLLEGVGVQPDFLTALDRKQLLRGIDSQLEKALSLIREDAQFPKRASTTVLGNSDPPPPPPKAVPKSASSPAAKSDEGPSAPTSPQRVKKGTLATVVVKALPSSTPEPAPLKDQRSLRVISEFITAIGGEEAFKNVKSFSLSGVSQ